MKCPACNGKRHKEIKACSVYECRKCGCIHGELYLGDSYGYVKPYFTTDPTADQRARPFDFMCLGSEGIKRRHGFYDPETKLITQVG